MRSVAAFLVALAVCVVLTFAPRVAYAHGTRTLTVDVAEVRAGHALVQVRSSTPGFIEATRVTFAEPCAASEGDDAGGAMIVECPGSLAGARVSVTGLGPLVSSALVVVTLADGRHLSHVLSVDDPSYVVPEIQGAAAVARGYVRLGVLHILGGYDHLLFLLSLVLLLRRPRAVILAETAFTVSHSISFSATALGWIRVSAAAAEAAIALSLVLVALDIGKEPAVGAARVAFERKGAAMAFVFGLVHGLGFAGGLREVGLPEAHVPVALLGFAGGVEVGQVAFLALALGAVHLATREGPGLIDPRRFEPVFAALIGGVASYWLLERTLVLFSRSA